MQQFNIREYVDFNEHGRAICPSCAQTKGATYKKTNLSVQESGAYHCFAGCTPDDIRNALGATKNQVIPTALAQPAVAPKSVTVSPQKILEAHQRLVNSEGAAKDWLQQRGITEAMIARHQLGIVRAKAGDRHLPAISIPLPNADGTAYYQKKRVAPWFTADEQPDGYQPWSQAGIPARTFFTYLPAEATATWLCEGEWDAIVLGWHVRQAELPVAVACFTAGCNTVPPPDQLDLLPGQVSIFYDRNDKPTKLGLVPGDEGAKKVAAALGDRARIALVPMTDGCDVQGWDVSNALNAGFKVSDFVTAAAAAKTPIVIDAAKPKKPQNPLRSRLITNDELLARAPDYVEWLIPDLLTMDELFVLAAPPRGGKSLLAMSLALAVATGQNFLDRPVMQGSVLYVNLEDSEAKLKEREQAQGWGEGVPVYWLDKFKLNELEHLIELADEIDDLRLIVLDTLSRIRSDATNEGAAEMGQVLEPLQELAKRKKVCILVIHHTKKLNADQASDGDIFDSIRGSGAIRATARGSLVIAPGENCYRLMAENGHGKHDLKIRQDLTTLEWKLLGRWNPIINLDQKAPVVEYLNRVGSADIDQIATETCIPKRSLYMVLARLCADGMLQKVGSRKAAVYLRPIQPIQQLNSLLNSANADDDEARGAYSTKNNIIISDDTSQSDHPTHAKDDHLGENDHLAATGNIVELGDQKAENVSCEGDSAIQQQFNKKSTVELAESKNEGDHPKKSDHLHLTSPQSDHFEPQSDQSEPQSDQRVIIRTGDRVRYCGGTRSMVRLCGSKQLEVIEANDEAATVKHSSWLVTQTVPLADLLRV